MAVIVFIVVVGVFVQKSSGINFPGIKTPEPSAPVQKTILISNKKISVEVADTNEVRAKGLSGRESLGESSGMLFVFDEKDVTPVFWMKGMLIPLDFIWIEGGKIVQIDKEVVKPAADTPDDKLKTYSPVKPVDYVLEVNAGFTDKNNIKVGDSVELDST